MLPKTKSSEKSVIFITMHKAGSVIANEILSHMLSPAGFVHVNFATDAFNLGAKEQPYCAKHAYLFNQPGYYFGAFRDTTSDWFGDLSQNRIIIQIRDPRDCIVSLYFSYRYSHPEPGKGDVTSIFNSLREEALDASIDEYVITKIEEYQNRFKVVTSLMSKFPNHILLKYEDMVLDFNTWYNSVLDFTGVLNSHEINSSVHKLADFKVEYENINSHKRQVTPGDFRRKTTLETQKKLSHSFSKILKEFNYEI